MIFNHHRSLSLRNQLLLITTGAITLSLLLSTTVTMLTLSGGQEGVWWLVNGTVGLFAAFVLTMLLTRHLCRSLAALDQGLLTLLDRDYSVTLACSNINEVNVLIEHYNQLTETLRRERQTLYQRELLLDTVIENSSMSVLIADQHQRVIFSNRLAEVQLHDQKRLNGLALGTIFADNNPELLTAVLEQRTGIFSLHPERPDLYHLFTKQFNLNSQNHTLILLKEMTRELNRQEAATWKKVIRIISHELNNSLAPISSLAHSGQLLLKKGQHAQLPEVFTTLSERAEHLTNFVSRYADIAKLPVPQRTSVDWRTFYAGLNLGYPFRLQGDLPTRPGNFDSSQIQQLLLNLLKNAAESGSPEDAITLRLTQTADTDVIEVADRGSGMSSEIMQNALLPFYSTKNGGSGVGLPLCREIAEAHNGQLIISNRRNGGLRVKVVIKRSA